MAVLGEFGETRVEPARLFDASDTAGAGPPVDALDVQFRAPLTFSLLVDALLRNDRELDARTCFQLYERVIDHTVREVQFSCGYVVDDVHGHSVPARLELAALGESDVPGIETVRMHHHLYIGRTAVSLRDARRLPVSADDVRLGLSASVWTGYLWELQRLSENLCGVHWGRPPGGFAREIVDPPLHEHMGRHELGVCPSPWGPRTIWEQPTRGVLAHEAELAARIARDPYTAPGRVLDY